MTEEISIFTRYLKDNNLKMTGQREKILNEFVKGRRHYTVDGMYEVMKNLDPAIGHATVFRTLRLFCECGLASELILGDKKVRYEPQFGHTHHDHLVCERCGKFIEVYDHNLEGLQDHLCKKHGFSPARHRLEIFGVCRECRKK